MNSFHEQTTSRNQYELLSLDRLAKVQDSAKSAYLGQCSQLVVIKNVCTMSASKNLPTNIC